MSNEQARRSCPRPASPSGSTTCPASGCNSGNLQELITDKHVVGVTTNPTIFAGGAGQRRGLRRAGPRARRARRRRSTTRSARSPWPTCRTPATCSAAPGRPPTASTAGSRSRSTRGWPTTPTAPSPRRWTCGRPSTGPTCWSRSRPPRRACRRSPSALAEGVSVNVTLIFSVERYREVMDAYLDGLEQAAANGHDLARHRLGGVASSSPAWTPRSTSGWRRSAPTRRWRCAARRRVANSRLAYAAFQEVFSERALGRRWPGRGRQAAASAVGLHRREEPGLLRHHVRHRAGRGRHRQHDAGEDAARLRRPRRGHGDTVTGTAARGPAGVRRAGRGRHRPHRRVPSSLENEGVEKFEKSWEELLETVNGQLKAAAGS